MTYLGRDDPQFRLRLPERLRSELEKTAAENERSLTAEIVSRLEHSFSDWPRIELPVAMRNRATRAPADKRRKAEQEIQAFVFRVAEHFFPKADDALHQFISSFHLVMDHAHHVTDEQRKVMQDDFSKLVESLHIETLDPDDVLSNTGEWVDEPQTKTGGRTGGEE